ncbi:MAG: hypothetical protein KatS3mg126_2380 [Lysobacteraceae bacterium]|nr:MAG: hypothetical protein KatS3mg126_2380 [Xanthomonadaceae bacterium]
MAAAGFFPEVGVFGMPLLVLAAVALAIRGHPGLAEWLLGHADLLWPFWVGSGFAFCWKLLEAAAGDDRGRRMTAAIAGVVGMVLVGGWAMLTDPRYLGFVVWPALGLVGSALAGGRDPRTR